jgi:hypothetical protein
VCEATEAVRGERAPSSRLPKPLLRTLLALLALLVHELGFWRERGAWRQDLGVSSPLYLLYLAIFLLC